MFKIDFSHITATQLKPFDYQSLFNTEPWSFLDLEVLADIDLDMDLTSRAINTFSELAIKPTDSLDILDILAMITVKNDNWQQKKLAEKVANNWWLSLINHMNRQKELLSTLVFVLQYQNNPDFYQQFANTNALISLTNTLKKGEKHTWHDKNLEFVSVCLITENPKNFAEFTLLNQYTIKKIRQNYPLPMKDSFIKEARTHWLNAYLELSEKELEEYRQIIQEWLNEKTDINFAVERTKLIFDNPYFSKDLPTLENQTHKFGDIFHWLKHWSKTPKFRILLGVDYGRVLNAWLGAGNYYQLKKVIEQISKINQEYNDTTKRSVSRYTFWERYQQYILDFFLIIPYAQQHKYANLQTENIMGNIRIAKMTNTQYLYPVILLKFDKYYFIQTLVGKAPEVDLMMTKDVQTLDKATQEENFNPDITKQVTPCLIHDHYQYWQQDLSYILAKDFQISTKKEQNIKQITINPERQKLVKTWLKRRKDSPHTYKVEDILKYAKNLQLNNV